MEEDNKVKPSNSATDSSEKLEDRDGLPSYCRRLFIRSMYILSYKKIGEKFGSFFQSLITISLLFKIPMLEMILSSFKSKY